MTCHKFNEDRFMTKDIIYNGIEYHIHEYGSILSKRVSYFIDQFDGITEVFARNFRSYLKTKYNISLEDYYCLVKFGELNSPKIYCPYCGFKRKFSENLSNGYRSICPNCKKTIKIINSDIDPIIIKIGEYTIFSPGRIVQKTNHKVYDQLDPTMSSYLILNRFSNIRHELESKYNMTEEEYYNLIVNGDKDYRPKCKCGELLEFRGVINGYHKLCYKCKGRNVPYEDIVATIGDYVIHYPGIIAKASHNKFINQLNLKVYSTSIKMMEDISKNYNLNEEQYYNLVVYGDPNKVHICSRPGCNNKIPYRGFYEGFRFTCSTECTNIMRSYGDNQFRFSSPLHQLFSYSSFIKNPRSNFYYAEYVYEGVTYSKIGVSVSIEGRSNGAGYNYCISLYEGTPTEVAIIECIVKFKFLKYCGVGLYKTESYPISMKNEILKFINKLLISVDIKSIDKTDIRQIVHLSSL